MVFFLKILVPSLKKVGTFFETKQTERRIAYTEENLDILNNSGEFVCWREVCKENMSHELFRNIYIDIDFGANKSTISSVEIARKLRVDKSHFHSFAYEFSHKLFFFL